MRKLIFLLLLMLIATPCFGQEVDQIQGCDNTPLSAFPLEAKMSLGLIGSRSSAAPPANGVIGQIDGAGGSMNNNDIIFFSPFTPTTAGTVGYGHARVSSGSNGKLIVLGLFDATGAVLAYGSFTVVTELLQWVNVPLTLVGAFDGIIVAETTYYLGVNTEGITIFRSVAETAGIHYNSTNCEAPPAALTVPGDHYSNYAKEILFDNVATSPE